MTLANFVSTTDKMKSMKAALDNAPAGPKKAAAQMHYLVAERAHTAQKDADCLRALTAASDALA